MRKTFLLLTAAMLLLTTANAKIKVHTIGDSTMADYDENTTDKRGWCQYLQSFFDTDSITINNRGKSGADTRQFYNNNWPSVKSQMAAGDYLLIQFAHNDEGTVTYGTDNLELAAYNAANGLPALTDARGTCPYSTYRDMLRLYIDEARALGVNPILVGPICRKYFNGNTIKRNGQHDLGDNFWKLENGQLLKNQSIPTSDHTMDYVEAMRIVAQEKNVPFINLTEATKNLYLQLGEATCTSTLFCNGDNTHLKAGGAIQVGRLGAQMLKDSIPALASFITIPTSLTISPAQISIGETYSGIMQQKEVLLSGSGLTPEIGTITATASANLSLSIDGETYSPSLSLSYSGGTLFQRVKVQASYAAAGLQTDSIVFVCGDQQTVVTINAMVISLDGGMNVSANWTIADKTTLTDVLTEGPISAVMTLHNMVATDSKAEFTNGSESTISMVRIHNADANGAKAEWPANEIDENVSRYIDFAITAPAEAQLRIVRISMDMAAHSSNFICLHVNIGMNDNMEGVVTIAEKKNLTNKQIYSEVWTPTITVPAGQTLHVRILPWHEYSEAKSGKYIALSNVVIEGVVFEESSETNILTPQEHISVEKRMVNGQLLIIKDGVAYTILCERIPLPANL